MSSEHALTKCFHNHHNKTAKILMQYLKKLGSLLVGGVGTATEQEVGDEDVKSGGEAGNLAAPSVGVESKSVEQHQSRLVGTVTSTCLPRPVLLRHPTFHGAAIVELHQATLQATETQVLAYKEVQNVRGAEQP